LATALTLSLLISSAGLGYAARTLERDALPSGDGFELIVFEVEGCSYCQLFRRDILPTYAQSPRAAEVPIRFVDLNLGTRGVKLDGPIEVVPTAVLVRDNREAGRIAGYAGPESFFRMMRFLLGK
jgi:thioredoxin-related protein